MVGGEEYPQRGTPIGELADELARLCTGEVLTIAEFSMDGIVIWEVQRDQVGTPHCRYWPIVSWPDDGSVPTDEKLDEIIQTRPGSSLILASGLLREPYATLFDRFSFSRGGVPSFRCTSSLAGMLRHVLIHDPLVQWYELVTLQRTPSGPPILKGHLLFPPGAKRGDKETFRIRCEPADENGTVFAVVATEQVRRFRLVSLSSANVPPGVYRLTAELRRPGVVCFRDLPAGLQPEHRTWAELVTQVPAQLDVPQPAHLICAIETSGVPNQVFERLRRAEQLIRHAAEGVQARLSFSLVSYGTHSFERNVPADQVTMHVWEVTAEQALAALGDLRTRGAAPTGYHLAAQLECALTEINDKLRSVEGRPIIVAIGARPPFPRRSQLNTALLPCPHRRDWRRAMERLLTQPGISLGAIHGPGPVSEIWMELGRKAFAHLDAFDVHRFAADLGLRNSSPSYVPFPVIESEES